MDIPNITCGQCKYYDIRAGEKGHESKCKRIDHKMVQFAIPWFQCYDCGYHHIICNDFEPKNPEYKSFENWKGFEDYWEKYKEEWLPYKNENTKIGFVLNGDTSIRYLVPLKKFIDGHMIENGFLMADEKIYYKRSRTSGFGYTLAREKINGIKINEV